ncbi:hypothetical protein AKJ09_08005 [Labilithrix luteola]|uniref:Tryptophan synthase alpha chain n=2 Tax=Labilithrix luteola TaxID=1391654 RepID=A0A0K1Q6R8_9BACT|nr:hypothetical protein AKJ09_08005 [Labilithrix luteola]
MTVAWGVALTLFVAMAACVDSTQTLSIGDDCETGFCGADGQAPSFTRPPDDAGDGRALVAYCPSNQCPEGYTTCENSRFPCDVNLKTDRDNCGACGAACPMATIYERFECIEGRCALACNIPFAMDCDGVADNGCETKPDDPNNCGACGTRCTDPNKPCVPTISGYTCGCDKGLACPPSPWSSDIGCVDPDNNDYNCGACRNACDPGNWGERENAYFGCEHGECGHMKCWSNWGDCDGNALNGCEASLATRTDCGACGNACPADQDCRYSKKTDKYECLCPAGKTYCDGECVDLATDPSNCGSCGYPCNSDRRKYSVGICTFGTCSRQCAKGRADCNGNPADDCETNIDSDPKNCGGCGIACDALVGQACVGGQCVIEPCEQGDGGPTAR